MNGKKMVICIIIVAIIIIVLSVVLFIINFIPKTENVLNTNELSNNVSNTTIQDVTDKSKFFTVANCVYQYLSEINVNNSKYYRVNDEQDEELNNTIKKNIYDLLSQEYIENNSITISNVYKYVDNITEQVIFTPIKMKVLKNEDIEKYVVQGFIQNNNNSLFKQIYIIVNLDLNKRTFSIEPINKQYTNIDDINLQNKVTTINVNDNNSFNFENANDEYIIKQYFNAYKRIALANPEKAYEYLDEEYREQRFINLEDYKKYVLKNKSKILSDTISKYLVTKTDQYKQYTCILENGDYFIIREKDIMQFDVILDTYTIDLPEYVEKYNKADEGQKTAYCINRFVQSINDENYKFAYSLLANGFKNNYFKTQASFENYIKQNSLQKQNITFEQFSNEGDVYYTYKVLLTNGDEDANPIEKTFIVKLGEGTSFELSFNVD